MSENDIVTEIKTTQIVIKMTPEGKDGVSMVPRGSWDESTDYAYMDLVTYDGESFLAKTAVQAGAIPSENPDAWMLIAQKGIGANETYTKAEIDEAFETVADDIDALEAEISKLRTDLQRLISDGA